ncbi:MAG: lamin tail domain-containing protein [Bacteroidetes bacterium]|nr:lamin tail domain-containing protein [Bacteroidota bacterium]
MRRIITFGIILFSAFVCRAQFADDFSDGDFTNNPVWTPDQPTNWLVAGSQLRSNLSIANSAFSISTPSALALNAQWEFYVNLQFNTSSLNYVDVYLISSNSLLTSADGYFVRIGGSTDEVSLYKSVAGVASLLINGQDGITNSSNTKLKIKVTRDAANLWKLERDASGVGNAFVTEGTPVQDNTFGSSSFFGIRVAQSTASFFNKHFFDDFVIGSLQVDTTPPKLLTVNAISSTQLEAIFDEPLEISSAEAPANYTVDQNVGQAISAQLQPDQKSVRLSFAKSFPNGIQSQLSISGMKDLLGNVLSSQAQTFLYFEAVPTLPKDIRITEIFADPSPQIGLPDAEYIEIYNRSANPIDLAGWKLSDGSSTAIFPTQIILPNEYWIITSTSSVSKFLGYGKTIGLSNFPTLNNDGDALTVSKNSVIDSVRYQSFWYRDEDKQSGGWSLELIDPENTCGEANNWVASEDAKGGTPGKQNAVFANNPDLTGPGLISVAAAPTNLQLWFDEKLEKPLGNIEFAIEPLTAISTFGFANSELTSVRVELAQSLSKGILYTIQVNQLRDCAGNFIQPAFAKATFALPEPADSLDVVINEILFNPRTGGVDFVEVYNRSTKFINLKNFSIANFPDGVVQNSKTITTDLLLAPNSFLVFASDTIVLKMQYPKGVQKNFYQLSLPSFNDDQGTVAVVDNNGKVIDAAAYDEKWHIALLRDVEGVSLERISAEQSSMEPANWRSANSVAGFATPGYINSNSRLDLSVATDAIQVEPLIFSPNRPGQDFSKISYRFAQPGFAASVKILDQQGRQVRELANNETLGYEGFFRWDGDQDNGNKARLGYYVVWMEVFDTNGAVKTFRERIILADGQ